MRTNPNLGTIIQHGSNYQLGSGGNLTQGEFLDLYAGGAWLPCQVQLSRNRLYVVIRMGDRRGNWEVPVPQPCRWLFRRVLGRKTKQ